MGLDANLYAVNTTPSRDVDFAEELFSLRALTDAERAVYIERGYSTTDIPKEKQALKSGLEVIDVHYFRKHHDLHGWMEELYYQKGGVAESFNCVPVALNAADLDRLEKDVKGEQLPSTSGFFFGSGNTAGYQEETLDMIKKCREALDAGMTPFYDSWW